MAPFCFYYSRTYDNRSRSLEHGSYSSVYGTQTAGTHTSKRILPTSAEVSRGPHRSVVPGASPRKVAAPLRAFSLQSFSSSLMPIHATCAVWGCMNAKPNSELAFFSLPENPERLAQWLTVMDREDLTDKRAKSYLVCEQHFVKGDILQSSNRKMLKKNCVPLLNLPPVRRVSTGTQSDTNTTGCFTQTDPRSTKTKHTQTIKRKTDARDDGDPKRPKESKAKKKEDFHELCDKFLTPELSQLVKTQSNLKFNFKGNRYDTDYKVFCLNLYYTSPDAYKTLMKVLCLPCANTLTTFSIPISTEINYKLMSSLKAKVDRMTDPERNCSIIIDCMPLKACLYYSIREDRIVGLHEVNGSQVADPARKALVIMARGIFENWKQPIGFALLSEFKHNQEIAMWLDAILARLFEIGLNVRTFISDLESDWIGTADKSVSVETPYFFVSSRKIYYIYDPPHLINAVRDNLMICDFYFGDSVARWKHVMQFYEYDRAKSFKLAPKLKDNHINPTKLEKTTVLYATQLLSNAVAAGISNYVDFQVIEESARGTVKFITLMNNLFDALNSSSLNDDYPYKRAYSGSEAQISFFYQMLHFFQTLKINKVTHNRRDPAANDDFISAFRITIRAIILMYEDLQIEGYTFLLTRRLNQETAEKFFQQIRSQIGTTKTPTSRQFVLAFRKLFFTSIIKPLKGGNGADDLAKLLVQTNKFEGLSNNIDTSMFATEGSASSSKEEAADISAHATCSDYNKLNIPEKNSLIHMCGFILKKCQGQHTKCGQFDQYMNANKKAYDFSGDARYLRYHEYLRASEGTLRAVPPDDFIVFVEKLEVKFIETFESKRLTYDLGTAIYKGMEDLPYSPPCECFPIIYAKKMFIRLRLFYMIKHNNKLFGIRRGAKRKYFSVGNLT